MKIVMRLMGLVVFFVNFISAGSQDQNKLFSKYAREVSYDPAKVQAFKDCQEFVGAEGCSVLVEAYRQARSNLVENGVCTSSVTKSLTTLDGRMYDLKELDSHLSNSFNNLNNLEYFLWPELICSYTMIPLEELTDDNFNKPRVHALEVSVKVTLSKFNFECACSSLKNALFADKNQK